MNFRAGLREYILQTRNTKNFEDSMGVEPPNQLPSGYATATQCAKPEFYHDKFLFIHRCSNRDLRQSSFPVPQFVVLIS